MELIERANFLEELQAKFEVVAASEGHCVLVSGEAGIGKTSLIKTFCSAIKDESKIFQGTCDSLFTPRPLAPVYDILWQMKKDNGELAGDVPGKATLFTHLYQELERQEGTTVII